MTSYINDILNRIAAIEAEYMVSIGKTCDAKPYFSFTGEAYPYIVNRLADTPISDDGSEVEDVQTLIFIARFVIGNTTAGMHGEEEYNMYEWIADFPKYINRREMLQSAAYPTRPLNFVRARCFNGGGFRIFDNAGIGSQQVGAELQIRIERDEYIEQVYLGD